MAQVIHETRLCLGSEAGRVLCEQGVAGEGPRLHEGRYDDGFAT